MAKKENPSVTVESLATQVSNLSAKIQRMSDNWKRFCSKFVGSAAQDGTIKTVKMGMFLVVALSVAGSMASAADVPHASGDKFHVGTAAIQSDGTFTNNGDLYIADDGVIGDDFSVGGTLTASAFGGSGASTVQTFVVKDTLTVNTNAVVQAMQLNGALVGQGAVFTNLVTARSVSATSLTGTTAQVNGNITVTDKGTFGTNIVVGGGISSFSGTTYIYNSVLGVKETGSGLALWETAHYRARGAALRPTAGIAVLANPVASVYEISPSAVCTQQVGSITDAGLSGQYITLINVSGATGTNIFIDDATNMIVNGSAVTLGQYDSITLRWSDCFDGTDKWVEVSGSDN